MQPAAAGSRPRLVYLPNTCPENRRHHTHLKLLSHVDPDAGHNLGFEGRVLFCGCRLPETELPARPVLLEYAGPQGQWKRGKQRYHLYILWRYDFQQREWVEICRDQSIGWEWALTIRHRAVLELAAPVPPVVDVAIRGRAVAEELLTAIDTALIPENPEARLVALTSIYDQVAGRIAQYHRSI
jgi:hypothetical protein